MFIKYDKTNYSQLFDHEESFILMVYFMGQGEEKENGEGFKDLLTIYPSFIKKYDKIKQIYMPNHLVEFEKNFPEIKIVEAYHYQIYDLIIDLGYDYDSLWRENDKIFTPLIFAFKSIDEYETSYRKCYCVETLTELSIFIRDDLFKPSRIG